MPVITHIDEYHIEIEISDEMLEEEIRKNRHMGNQSLSNYTPPKIPEKQRPTGQDELRGRMPIPPCTLQRRDLGQRLDRCSGMEPIESPSAEDLIYIRTLYNSKGDAKVQLIRSNFPKYCWKTRIIRRTPFTMFGLFNIRQFNERVNRCVDDMEKLRLEWLDKDERAFKKRVEGDGWH